MVQRADHYEEVLTTFRNMKSLYSSKVAGYRLDESRTIFHHFKPALRLTQSTGSYFLT
jgi:hypothetical protein